MRKFLLCLALMMSLPAVVMAQSLPTPTVHKSDLTWNNTCDASMTCSFNVYRCSGTATTCTTGGTGTWTLLNFSPLSATGYTDLGVNPGTTYQYLVYATATVNNKLQTSNPSNQFGGTIPLGPTPVAVTGTQQ
jgi:hypothetical protein